jgi:hypothetical protein
MDPENEKIQLDDITFDDVIGGDGVETVVIDEEVPTAEEPKNVEQEEVQEEEVVTDVKDEEPKPVEEEVQEVQETNEESEEEDATVVAEILKAFGYETDNAYEDTSEGLINMTKDIAQTLADERIDEVMDKFPLVRQHLEYVLNGGESQNFMQAYDPNLDYNRIKIESDDVRSQKAVLSEYFNLKGHDREFTKEMITDYTDSGKLHDKAEAARKALGKVQQQQQMQMVEQQKQMRTQQYQQQEEFWKGVADTLENGKEFSGLTVPEREKSKFFNYLSKPITEQGYTQRDLDHSEAALETRLAIDYLMFKGFNLDQIINTKAKTKNSKSLKDKILRNEENVKSARKSSRRPKNFDIDELDLSI